MASRSKEIFTEEIREKMAIDIAGIIGEFYKDPENVKAYEIWKTDRASGCQGCCKD